MTHFQRTRLLEPYATSTSSRKEITMDTLTDETGKSRLSGTFNESGSDGTRTRDLRRDRTDREPDGCGKVGQTQDVRRERPTGNITVEQGDVRNEYVQLFDAGAQRRAALQSANAIRTNRAVLLRELRACAIRVEDLLEHEALASCTVFRLLTCQHRWGEARARSVLGPLHISDRQKVGRLTEGQRRHLVAAVDIANRNLAHHWTALA